MITVTEQIENLNKKLEIVEKPNGNSGVEEKKGEINSLEERNTIFKSAQVSGNWCVDK